MKKRLKATSKPELKAKLKPWPICTNKGCDNEVNPKRIEVAGYTTCLECGTPKKNYLIIPVPKSNGVVGTMEDLVGIASSHKGARIN